jgi:hypothetical protein
MHDTRLVILHNTVAEEETCPRCLKAFVPAIGYIVVEMHGDKPATANDPVCNECVQKQEPELLRMIELQARYAEFEAEMAAIVGGR